MPKFLSIFLVWGLLLGISADGKPIRKGRAPAAAAVAKSPCEDMTSETAAMCAAELRRIRNSTKPKNSHYRVSAETGLRHFGVDLVDQMAKPIPRGPASK